MNVERTIAGLHVRIVGDGPPVLLLHGLGASGLTWSSIESTLQDSSTVVTVDLRGFGRSIKPRDGHYQLRDHARAVLSLIDTLELQNLAIVGNSLGGGVALLIALQLYAAGSDRLRSLVLIDSIGAPQAIPLFVAALRCPGLGKVLLRCLPARWSVAHLMRKAYYRASRIDPDRIKAYAMPLRSAGGRHALVETARGLIPPDLPSLLEQYRDLDLPVLLFWGRKDRIVPLTVGRKLRALLPRARLLVIRDCGHMPQEERPDIAGRLLKEFLSSPGSLLKGEICRLEGAMLPRPAE